MTVFQTPEPITIQLEVAVGEIVINATERADTVVDVRPRVESNGNDRKAAEKTTVEYANGRLKVKTPKWPLVGKGGTVDITVDVPHGSALTGEGQVVDIRGDGRLGAVHYKIQHGGARFEQTGTLTVDTGHGTLVVGQVSGPADLRTGSGEVSIGQVDGDATVKNGNGRTRLGDVAGEVRVTAGNGEVEVETAAAGVTIKNSHGDIRVGEVARGTVLLNTTHGAVEVGIRQGTAAWLKLKTVMGAVRNDLTTTDGPGQNEETVEVHAHTGFGNITVRRAA
ncbi:DUF4097 family beta strand repeat-containing protein [Kibdelosporangium phytohabitans]|uniref:DUF4097 domain-containing protein n=1 Tax=Kibdelosporangium phytohabitans TaxID=860235 RepID=A0A0N9IBH0_9PSEU|nr:DUF4097 family beta strand repeat-containing protein [Kibdelosporangium phytohabitans]ALG13542.1 hypothetical protein AOZ06_47745 [Kibdelosporangium phytohabitans]MBE1465400.1 DUF4097 and DUF4098 domain-containing protein YvlB [Kibdelosporangium phytohabitans]